MSEHSKAMQKADAAFSRYIRARDDDGTGHFRCPTCGAYKEIEQADAGHYITRKRMAVRFDERNVHAQCRYCNRWCEGLHFIYRRWLVEEYGEAEVETLETLSQLSGAGYSVFDLEQIAFIYKEKLKKLLKDRWE